MIMMMVMTITSHLHSTRIHTATYVLHSYAAHPIEKSWVYCKWRQQSLRPTNTSRTALGLRKREGGKHSYSIGTGNYFSGVKRSKRKADHPPFPSNVEIKNKWSYTSTPPLAFTNATRTTLHHTGLSNTQRKLTFAELRPPSSPNLGSPHLSK
jgi:hypothetical protein